MSDDTKHSSEEVCDSVLDPTTGPLKMCGKSGDEMSTSAGEVDEENLSETRSEVQCDVADHEADEHTQVSELSKIEAESDVGDRTGDGVKITSALDDGVECNTDNGKDTESKDSVEISADDVNADGDVHKDDESEHISEISADHECGNGPQDQKNDSGGDNKNDEDCEANIDEYDDDDDDMCEDVFKRKEITMLITESNGDINVHKLDCTKKLDSGTTGTTAEKRDEEKMETTSCGEGNVSGLSVTASAKCDDAEASKTQDDLSNEKVLNKETKSDNNTVTNDITVLSEKSSVATTTGNDVSQSISNTDKKLPESATGSLPVVDKISSVKSSVKKRKTTFINDPLIDHLSLLADDRAKRRRVSTNSSKWLQPLDKGWRRELVFRATMDESKKRTADVYYYTPTKEKLRSGREIEEYLKSHGDSSLTPDCFSFSKCCISEPPKEIMRFAKQTNKLNKPKPEVNKTSAPQSNGTVKTYSALQKSVSTMSNLPKKGPKTGLLSKKLTNMINMRWPRKKIKKWKDYAEDKPCSLTCPGQIGVLPSLHCRVCLCLFHPPCIGFKDESQPFTCKKCVSEGRDSAEHHISLDIPISPKKANQPSVSYSSPSTSALPKLTVRPTTALRNFTGHTNLRPPPLTKAPGVAAPTNHCESIGGPIKITTWMPPCGIPSATRQPPPLRLGAPIQNIQLTGQIVRGPPPLTARPQTLLVVPARPSAILPKPPTTTGPRLLAPAVNSFPNIRPKTYANQSPNTMSVAADKAQNTKMPVNIDSTAKTMKFVLKTNVGETVEVVVPFVTPTLDSGPPQPEYIVVNKQGQSTGLMVRLGSRVIQLPILSQTTRKIPFKANNVQPGQRFQRPSVNPNEPPEMIVLDDDAAAGKNKQAVPNEVTIKPLIPNTTSTEKQTSNQSPLRTEPIASSVTSPSSKNANSVVRTDPAMSRSSLKKPRTEVTVNPAKCSIQWLHGGITALTKIFEYLPQGDLARASSVCQIWNLLASRPNLWNCVNLEGVLVYDWERLLQKMTRQCSFRLDMRKMLTFDDRNRTWHGFAAVLEELRHIKHIDFGPVPVSILHTVANTLKNLEVLTAEWVTDICRDNQAPIGSCRLDVGKFGQMSSLKTLRLRGVHGIQLLSSASNRCMSDLEKLHKVTHLSITSLKDVPVAELYFVKSLRTLTVLELGDCLDWTYKMYDAIRQLQHLKKLRLECNNVKGNLALSSTLSLMPALEHLELYHFHVDDILLKTLERLERLRWLSLCPNPTQLQGSLANTQGMESISKCVGLKSFAWGVLTIELQQKASNDVNDNPKGPPDVDIIDISDDDERDSDKGASKISDDNECIPIVLAEEKTDDKNPSSVEVLSLAQLRGRLSERLPRKTTSLIFAAQDKDAWELSHVCGVQL